MNGDTKTKRQRKNPIATEAAVMAEIGRLVGSTLDIDEVYERFAAEANKLIPFDRLSVNVKNPNEETLTIAYASGSELASRKKGDTKPLAATLSLEILHTRTGRIVQPEDTPEGIAEIVRRIPTLSPSFQSGYLSLLSVPLVYRDEALGVLHFRSKKPGAYTRRDLCLAERIGAQIAGAIANARLFTGLKKAEELQRGNRESAEQLANETAVIAEVGRLIGSTLNIDEVYERVAAEAAKLIRFDRLMVNLSRPQENAVHVAYAAGVEIPGRGPGAVIPYEGGINESLARSQAGLIIQPESYEEFAARYPVSAVNYKMGLRSLMSVPLISGDTVIGGLHFHSKEPKAYSEGDLRLAERIGAQIAGAIANVQLFTQLKRAESSLRESEGRFRALVEQAAVGVAEIDMKTGRFITVNRRLCEMVKRTEAELLTTTFQAITHPDDADIQAEKTALMQAGTIRHYSLEKRYLQKSGESVWVNITVSPLWKPGDAPGRNMVVVEDITERKRMQAESERRSRQLAELHQMGVDLTAELHLTTLLQSVAERALGLIGGDSCTCYIYNPESDMIDRVAMVGRELVVGGLSRRRGEGAVGKAWETGKSIIINDYHAWPGRKQVYDALPNRALMTTPICWGEEFLGVLNILAYTPHRYTETDLEILGMFATKAAIAIRNARLYHKIEQLSVTDELTGLFNRRGFFQLGQREFERSLRFSRPIAALMLDIDHFKCVNDTYGHPVGDQVLCALADCIRQNTRGIDVPGRYGGEEFILLLPETDLPLAIQIAERLRQSIADLSVTIYRGKDEAPPIHIRINVSIGVAFMRPDIPELPVLIDRADQALYRAKDRGRNRVVVWEG